MCKIDIHDLGAKGCEQGWFYIYQKRDTNFSKRVEEDKSDPDTVNIHSARNLVGMTSRPLLIKWNKQKGLHTIKWSHESLNQERSQ